MRGVRECVRECVCARVREREREGVCVRESESVHAREDVRWERGGRVDGVRGRERVNERDLKRIIRWK